MKKNETTVEESKPTTAQREAKLAAQREENIRNVRASAARAGVTTLPGDSTLAFVRVSFALELTLLEELLGTASNNPNLHREFVASRSDDAKKIEEEIEAIPTDERLDKLRTVFPRDAAGNPFIWDYQVKGFLKEAALSLLELGVLQVPEALRFTKWTGKRIMDRSAFVWPRAIALHLPPGGEIGTCIRPLRVMTPKGERVALAESETIPAGTTCRVLIGSVSPHLEAPLIQMLDYGQLAGLGQWRNSGKGRFSYKLL